MQWDVTFTHLTTSNTFRRTVEADEQTQAVIRAQALFAAPHQWKPIVAVKVPPMYYEKIAAWAGELDDMFEERELSEHRERGRFDRYNAE